MLAKIIIVGRVRRAAKVINTGKGKPFMACTVEVVRSTAGKEYTDYYSVNSYRDYDALVPLLLEGAMVCAEGVPGINQYESQGKMKANVKIIGSITPIGGVKAAAAAAPASAEYDPNNPPC